MLMPLSIVLAIIIALLRGGSLRHFSTIQIRWIPLVIATFGFQFLSFAPFVRPFLPAWASVVLYILSMALLTLWAAGNWRIPGMLLMATGLLMNFAAITTNGGHMPVSSASVRYSGSISRYERNADHIVNNSIMIDDNVRLWLLTDIFAVPQAIPFANVYSIGDILLTLGASILCYRTIRAAPQLAADETSGTHMAMDTPASTSTPVGQAAPPNPTATIMQRPSGADIPAESAALQAHPLDRSRADSTQLPFQSSE
jgi:Family of unknown function (DUF5317)